LRRVPAHCQAPVEPLSHPPVSPPPHPRYVVLTTPPNQSEIDAAFCDPLDTSDCILPFPSNFYRKADSTTATGYSVNISPEQVSTATATATPRTCVTALLRTELLRQEGRGRRLATKTSMLDLATGRGTRRRESDPVHAMAVPPAAKSFSATSLHRPHPLFLSDSLSETKNSERCSECAVGITGSKHDVQNALLPVENSCRFGHSAPLFIQP